MATITIRTAFSRCNNDRPLISANCWCVGVLARGESKMDMAKRFGSPKSKYTIITKTIGGYDAKAQLDAFIVADG